MNIHELDEIIACMPKGKTYFPYFQGRYAPMLLAWMIDDQCKVSDIKSSHYSGLLQKPPVKDVLAQSGNGTLSADTLNMAWSEPHDQFLLTLGKWGGESRRWQQTTRSGHNLVLQLNVHEGYGKAFEAYLPEHYKFLLHWSDHPVLNRGERELFRQTLGWVRLDINLPTGEALIEEIQSDWIRDLRTLQRRVRNNKDFAKINHYCGFVINRFNKIWDEALLCSALWFLREEIGIKKIWYHTYDSGNQLKKIRYSYPPKSLYTKLPRKFCFTETCDQPIFLSNDKSYRRSLKYYQASKSKTKLNHQPRWFQMQM